MPKTPAYYKCSGLRLVRVECLGPLAVKRPHTFWSTDRTTHRICGRCEREIVRLHLGRLEEQVVRESDLEAR